MKTCSRVLCLFPILLASFLAQAQTTSAEAEFMQAAEARTILHAERKLIVSRNLTLTPEEAVAFWPIYDS